MPQVGFDPKIPVFERAKTVRGLGGAATQIGLCATTAAGICSVLISFCSARLLSPVLDVFKQRLYSYSASVLVSRVKCPCCSSPGDTGLQSTPPLRLVLTRSVGH
jgi:hypothetical protein